LVPPSSTDIMFRRLSIDSTPRIKSYQHLEGIKLPMVEVEDNYIENMLLGLKDDKKMTTSPAPIYNQGNNDPNATLFQQQNFCQQVKVPIQPVQIQQPMQVQIPMQMQQVPQLQLRDPYPMYPQNFYHHTPDQYVFGFRESDSVSQAQPNFINLQYPPSTMFNRLSPREEFRPSEDKESTMSISPSSSPLRSSSPIRDVHDKTRETKWKEHYQELIHFKKENGHTNVTQTKSKPLAEWVKNQRRLRKAGKLAKSRISKLDETGFEWDRSYLFKNKKSSSDRPISRSSSEGSLHEDQSAISLTRLRSRNEERKRKPLKSWSQDEDYDS